MRPRKRRRQRGQALVEMALIAPVLISMSLGILDLGRLFYYDVEFQSALREAARYAAKNPSVSSTTLQTMIQNEGNLPSGSVGSVSIASVTGTLGGATIEQVTATYSFTFISPWFQRVDSISNPLSIRTYTAAELTRE